MTTDYSPINSEVLVFIGAGATASLGMPTSDTQTKIFRNLCEEKKTKEEILSEHFSGSDLKKTISFLELLDGDGINFFEVSEKDLDNAKIIYGNHEATLLRKRTLELRSEYDWNAAKEILKICPYNHNNDNLIRDAYSIIDKKLLTHQSLKVYTNGEEVILSESRLLGARNFLTLFINMLFASVWNKITTEEEKAESFCIYKRFINSFDILMQKEAHDFHRKYSTKNREFYLFTASFVSFNFEMFFPWILMNSHYELNHRKSYIEDSPLKLWLDFGCEHRGRKTDNDGNLVSTLEFTEAVASRENEDEHNGSEINRCGKFYFAHGSSNWRECPVCGRMTFYNGDSKLKWQYKSKQLIPPFPIPLFENEKLTELTKKEKEWREKNLEFDALQCMHCGSKTLASNAPMIMQTMYKSTPTSFLEEIQRNVKVSIEKARHIILLGYSLPVDDAIWQQAFAEGVRSRIETNQKAYCTVVVGHKGEKKWIYSDELDSYISRYKNADATYGVSAIENAIAIFEKKNVRAWTGGIPQVFGNGTESDVKELFYPDFIIWNGTRLEK